MEQYQDIYLTASDKKLKKGDDGINAALVLMKDIRDFQDKVEMAMESQSNPENREKIESFYENLETMYSTLLEIASGGIRQIRKKEATSTPIMLNTPIIPKM